MVRCAKDIGFRVTDDHQADACGIYMEALAVIAPERLTDFDPLFGYAR